jgi:hypothetical protein
VYAHHAADYGGGPPAEPEGFETDVDTSAESLAPEHLPGALREQCREMWDGLLDDDFLGGGSRGEGWDGGKGGGDGGLR